MSDAALLALAEQAGIAPRWHDVFGKDHDVTPDTLRAVLAALGIAAGSEAELRESAAALRGAAAQLLPLTTALAGAPVTLPVAPGRYRITLESGGVQEGITEAATEGCRLPPIAECGYHQLELGAERTTIAVAPQRCFTAADAVAGRDPWGIAVQLYGLRRRGDGGIGDFAALADFVRHAGAHGADAVAISPVHAQFSADPERFSPYAPSNRAMLNVLHAALDDPFPGAGLSFGEDRGWSAEAARLEGLDLVDWPAATRARLARMRAIFPQALQHPGIAAEFAAFRAAGGDLLESHARFEALHAELFGADPSRWHWRDWPERYRDPRNPAVGEFAAAHAEAVAFHAFAQFLAARGIAAAQQAARDAGLAIGLVADLAVGTDSGGSHCWSRQSETLLGLSIGAPPDLLSRDGQNWGLAAFSPRGLALEGYAAYLEMLRAVLRHAGGVRIDHGMGLNRLWVVPEGAPSSAGAYLSFPERDLLRLVALESQRHRAIVLAEDLGTVPEGFQDRLQADGISGMRVLWFERDEERFLPPQRWTRLAVSMTSTHDLPTVAGWWGGRDIEWRSKLGLLGDAANAAKERETRERDREQLWQAFCESGAASGGVPSPEQGERAADAAATHIGRSACMLAMLPVEDALALAEQPNLPGTLDEHPNWRRRLPGPAETLLDEPAVATRLAALDRARRSA